MITIKRILCPVDFSECATHALDHAVAIARCYRATITVLHVYRLPTPVAAVAPAVMPIELMMPPLMPEARAQLEAAVGQLGAAYRAGGVAITTQVVEDLSVAGAIVAAANSERADLLVLGTHGRSGFDRLLLGSVTEKVLRKAGCPVLTVPPRADEAASRTPSYPHILCPVDFSSASSRALQYAASLATEAGATITLLHVVELPPDPAEPSGPDLSVYRSTRFTAAGLALARLTATMPGSVHTTQRILSGKPYKEILRQAEEGPIDLIVMGVQGRGAVDLAFFGSTTQHVVRQARCPVLTLRAPES